MLLLLLSDLAGFTRSLTGNDTAWLLSSVRKCTQELTRWLQLHLTTWADGEMKEGEPDDAVAQP